MVVAIWFIVEKGLEYIFVLLVQIEVATVPSRNVGVSHCTQISVKDFASFEGKSPFLACMRLCVADDEYCCVSPNVSIIIMTELNHNYFLFLVVLRFEPLLPSILGIPGPRFRCHLGLEYAFFFTYLGSLN